jgi:hypothetical protein
MFLIIVFEEKCQTFIADEIKGIRIKSRKLYVRRHNHNKDCTKYI